MTCRTVACRAVTWALLLAALAALPVGLLPAARADDAAPEAASGYTPKSASYARDFMIAAANPLAVDAGYRILKAGGSAVDAAIATQMVLTLVEPQSSGIGGGTFLLHFDGKDIQAFDGRETAPAAASENLFQNPDGSNIGFHEAVVGGRATGVPGVLRMLELAHRQHGRLPWATLFAPAITLAREGFAVSPRLHKLMRADSYLKNDPTAAAYFYDTVGEPWPVGHRLKNSALARTLDEIARGGAAAFHVGRIADDIVAKVQGHPRNPGELSARDMANYRAVVRAPICSAYQRWNVCGVPPPSSGGIAVAQMLGILERRDIGAFPPQAGALQAQAVHLFSEAGRLAYADRARYVADPDFVALPGNSVLPLIDKAYLAGRAALITERSMGVAKAGAPLSAPLAWGRDASPEMPSTSHISIVDARGNAVAMTTTIENAFGSRQMVNGFLLNNQLTDFSFASRDADGPVANRVEGGKRPRSSLAPTFVFDTATGQLVLITGSPGGSAIINYVAKVLVGTLDWGLDAQQAIALPNMGSRNGATELERGRVSETLVQALKAKGHEVRLSEQVSGVQSIARVLVDGRSMWLGAADPRREGTARGD